MNTFRWLLLSLLGLVIWLGWCAHADASVGRPEWQYFTTASIFNGQRYPSVDAFCAAGVVKAKQSYPQYADRAFTQEFCNWEPNQGVGILIDPNPGFKVVYPVYREAGACPSGSTPNGGDTCECTAPLEENSTHTACETPKSEWEKKCNSVAGQGTGRLEWAGIGNNACGNPGGLPANQGCLAVAGNIAVRYQATPGNWISGSDSGSYTGATCVPNDSAPAATKDPCVNGQSGVVNGKQKCVPIDPSTPIKQTDSSTTKNPDGSTTVKESSTSCDAGTCTTTTTTTTSGSSGGGSGGGNGGDGTTTTTTTQSIGSYCKDNPQAAACLKTNGGKGSETGDDKSDGECDSKSTVIGCMKPGTPPTDKEIPKDTKTVALSTTPVSGFGASCPAPTTFVVSGRTFTISYQPLCDMASWIKPLILLVGAFISLGIVYSALKGA